MLQELKRQIIINHYSEPDHKVDDFLNCETCVHGFKKSEVCIDEIEVEMNIDASLIKNITFKSNACTVATAAVDILISIVNGKSKEEAIKLIDKYILFLNNEIEYDDALGELNVFQGIDQTSNRYSCATMGALLMKETLLKEGKEDF